MARIPYVMPAELMAESNGGVDWSKVYPDGTLTTEQKLAKVCREVSDTVDSICGKYVFQSDKKYVLEASENTESDITTERVRAAINIRGELVFIATYRPVISVSAFTYQPTSVALGQAPQVIDLTQVKVSGRDIIANGTWEMYRYSPLWVSVTYVNGYANTLISSDVAAAATSIVVDDATGIVVGQDLEVMDDPAEGVVVSAITGTTLTLASPLSAAHTAGVRITDIPRDVTRAAIYLAWDIAQDHAKEALSIARLGLMGGDDIRHPINFYKKAVEKLDPYILTP